MKITFEFDTDSENFDCTELERYKSANSMAICLNEIAEKVRFWYNKDDREAISTEEISEVIFKIINENVNMEKIGY